MTARQKPWYKKWWGIIIAILTLPYFLIWFVWTKTAWVRKVKVGATAALALLCIMNLVWFSNWASHQSTQPVARKIAESTQPAPTTPSDSTAVACQKPSTPVSTQNEYTNADQIIQVLASHHVPCSNVVKDTGISSFTGATSGVWVKTAPGDDAAQFGGSENAGTDTEIVVFQSHSDAVAYANIGASDGNHQFILGTNWAIDAATPAVSSIRTALGVTSQSSTSTTSATPKPAATPAPATETVGQKNAVAKAEEYISVEAFSHDGLIDQLEYDQFSAADATYGADNCGADWNQQAAKKAKEYMDTESFSRQGLIDQLEYDKFTPDQASHGADSVGL